MIPKCCLSCFFHRAPISDYFASLFTASGWALFLPVWRYFSYSICGFSGHSPCLWFAVNKPNAWLLSDTFICQMFHLREKTQRAGSFCRLVFLLSIRWKWLAAEAWTGQGCSSQATGEMGKSREKPRLYFFQVLDFRRAHCTNLFYTRSPRLTTRVKHNISVKWNIC